MSEDIRNQDYDSEPVRYCSHCLSLKVKYEDTLGIDFCADCGNSDILETSIEEWEKLYKEHYGHRFTEKEKDPTKTFIFQLSIAQLKSKVYSHDKWKSIIKSIYPNFPDCYNRIDSVLLFFDALIKQNRIDELRLLLHNHFK